jgi:hypothetical protein
MPFSGLLCKEERNLSGWRIPAGAFCGFRLRGNAMSLAVIGSGFGRTGTKSMYEALPLLGFGPCHHMFEVLSVPGQIDVWRAVAADPGNADWAEVYKGYRAQVDWPGARVWHEASIAFPDAKVIHTERPEEDWWRSYSTTIGKFFTHAPDMPLPPHVHELFGWMKPFIVDQVMGDQTSKEKAIAAYRANNRKVREVIPADRLLVFNVADGWGPLCSFLGVPVPDTAFPHSNPRKEFWEVFGGEPDQPATA